MGRHSGTSARSSTSATTTRSTWTLVRRSVIAGTRGSGAFVEVEATAVLLPSLWSARQQRQWPQEQDEPAAQQVDCEVAPS